MDIRFVLEIIAIRLLMRRVRNVLMRAIIDYNFLCQVYYQQNTTEYLLSTVMTYCPVC